MMDKLVINRDEIISVPAGRVQVNFRVSKILLDDFDRVCLDANVDRTALLVALMSQVADSSIIIRKGK